METLTKLETQTSIESNEINNEITKLTLNLATKTNTTTISNNNFNEDVNNKTPTPISFGNPDTFMYFSSTSRSLSYKSINGKIRKPGANYVFKQENIKSYTDTHGIVYNVNDHVYMDINKPNQPFAIACVLDFKLTKRDNVVIEVRWYYRPNEIPDGVYMPLMQDRITENDISTELYEPIIKGRELFASESRDIYPATFIKGKCRVFHFQDIIEAKNFKPFADTFFCILTYNPEARRLANIQGEIRVGASHQAKLPVCQSERDHKELRESLRKWETCNWKCKSIKDAALYQYLQAARSIAAFAGICDRGSMDDMYEAAQCDTTSLYAFNVLHDCNYDTEKALKLLVKTNHTSKMLEKKWNEEDQKKFVKGLSQFGKNFFRIRKELLPHKETPQLVEFYYLWKKTQSAQQNRFRRRLRPSSAKKMTQTPSSNKKTSSTNGNSTSSSTTNTTNNEQFSGASDIDSDNDSDESSDQKQSSQSNQPKCCSNCFTSASSDLQNGGRDSQLLCYDCRMFYKKYGELPKIGNDKSTPATSKLECNLLKRITDEDEFNKNCDKECADTIEKSNLTKETSNSTSTSTTTTTPTSNLNDKTLTPSQLDSESSPVKEIKQETNHSVTSSPEKSVESPCCVSPDLPADQLVDDFIPRPIHFIFNKPVDLIKPESNAMFARVWDRGPNTCTRTDVQFCYLPNSKYIRDRALKKESNNSSNQQNNNNNNINSKQVEPAPIQMPTFPPGNLPPNFNFNFKDMLPNGDDLQMMNKLLLPPHLSTQQQPHQPPTNSTPQPPPFNPMFNNFSPQTFNKPIPQRPQIDPLQQQLQNHHHHHHQHQQQHHHQHFLQQMEQVAKQMNMNSFGPFLNSNNPNMPMLNDFKQAAAAAANQTPSSLPTGLPKFPYEFELNPALRQLRDIADKSNLINSFNGLNNNPMFNYFQQ